MDYLRSLVLVSVSTCSDLSLPSQVVKMQLLIIFPFHLYLVRGQSVVITAHLWYLIA